MCITDNLGGLKHHPSSSPLIDLPVREVLIMMACLQRLCCKGEKNHSNLSNYETKFALEIHSLLGYDAM
jgi:hypothetical protein